MKQLTQNILFMAIVAAALFHSQTQATAHKRDLQNRQKRSLSWIPFFGSGSSGKNAESEDEDSDTDDSTAVYNGTPDENSLPQSISQQFTVQRPHTRFPNDDVVVHEQIPAESVIASMVNQGHIVSNQLHYPIWRVHKYNGIHLRPLPVSLVAETDARHTQSVQDSNTLLPQHRLPDQLLSKEIVSQNNAQANSHTTSDVQLQNHLTSQSAQDYPTELIALARQFGISDLSIFPSLDEAMNLLGTTTQEETIKTIKEIASTEDGRNLIRQFIGGRRSGGGGGGGGGTDNEVAASTVDETFENAGNDLINQYLLASEEQTEDVEEDPAYGEEEKEKEDEEETEQQETEQQQQEQQQDPDQINDSIDTAKDVEQTNASIFQRISQWANSFNPLAGRSEEISNASNDDDGVDGVDDENIEFASDAEEGQQLSDNDYVLGAQSVPIPSLAKIQRLPEVFGENYKISASSVNHVPHRYEPRLVDGQYIPSQRTQTGGTYVRVRLPLAGFNPTPQIAIDPKYLYHYYNQLARQNQHLRFQQPQTLGAKFAEAQLIQSIRQHVMPVNHPDPRQNTPKIAQSYELPSHQAKHIFRSEIKAALSHTQSTTQHENHAQHENFEQNEKSAQHKTPAQLAKSTQHEKHPQNLFPPKISDNLAAPISFATPSRSQSAHAGQLPLIGDANYEVFKNAPRIVTSYGTPALPYTYSLDESVNTFQPSAFIHQEYELRSAASETTESERIIGENAENVEFVERSDNDGTTATPNHANDTDVALQSVEVEKNDTKETEPVAKSALKNQNKRRTNLNNVVTERKGGVHKRSSNIQRITPYDTFAAGKLHKADPKAIESLPYTVRRLSENDAEIDEEQQQ